MRTTLIGVGHYSRVGKDSFANALVTNLKSLGVPAVKRSFAWKLKKICHELYSWAGLKPPEFYELPENEQLRNVPLPLIGKSPVEIWVEVGNKLREVYGKTWIQYLVQNLEQGVTVVPDVRFPNEINAIRGLGGHVIKIIRPGFPPRGSVSDRALLGFNDWDMILGQSGDIEDLRVTAKVIANCIANKEPFPVQDRHYRMRALEIERETLQAAGVPI